MVFEPKKEKAMSVNHSKAVEIRKIENLQFTDIEFVNTFLNEYYINNKYKKKDYRNLDYWKIERDIRTRFKETGTQYR